MVVEEEEEEEEVVFSVWWGWVKVAVMDSFLQEEDWSGEEDMLLTSSASSEDDDQDEAVKIVMHGIVVEMVQGILHTMRVRGTEVEAVLVQIAALRDHTDNLLQENEEDREIAAFLFDSLQK